MMTPISGSPPVNDALALLTVLADPKKTKAALAEFAAAEQRATDAAAAVAVREIAVASREAAAEELNAALVAKSADLSERETLLAAQRREHKDEVASLDRSRAEWGQIVAERETAVAERETAVAERETAIAGREDKAERAIAAAEAIRAEHEGAVNQLRAALNVQV